MERALSLWLSCEISLSLECSSAQAPREESSLCVSRGSQPYMLRTGGCELGCSPQSPHLSYVNGLDRLALGNFVSFVCVTIITDGQDSIKKEILGEMLNEVCAACILHGRARDR